MVVVAAVVLTALIGRNDGSPMTAAALKASRGRGLWAPAVVLLALPAAPLLGLDVVANSLARMFGSSMADPLSGLCLMAAVLVTVGVSQLLAVPTSITLALVGALAGTLLGQGQAPDWPHVARVLTLAAIAPTVAAGLAYVLRSVPLPAPSDSHVGEAVVRALRATAFSALAIAYSINDGQKITFLLAVALSGTVGEASASVPGQLIATLVFGTGLIAGLPRAVRSMRSGVYSPTPLPLLWAEVSTVVTLSTGAVLGTPMSLTQSLQGALLGTGLARGVRVIRWQAARKILVAWAWTLPLAGVTAFLITSLFISVGIMGGKP